MYERPRRAWAKYGVAVAVTALSLLVRWPLWPVLGDAVPHMTFFPAVMLAAYFGGFWPGIVATVLSAAAANYFRIEHVYGSRVWSANDVAALMLFVLVGAIISGLCESLHRARHRIVVQERQRAADAVREIDERFRQLAENIREIFWVKDALDDRLIYVSPGFEEIWGRTTKAISEPPRNWLADSIHPDDRNAVIERMEKLRHGVSADSEFRVVRPDGSTRWLRSRAFPIKDKHGNVSRIAGLAEDITERKRAEEALRESEMRLHRLLDVLPAAAYTCDTEGLITYFNERAVELWGRSPKLNDRDDRFCGSTMLLGSDGKEIPHDQCLMAVAIKERRAIKGIATIVQRSDGSRRNVLAYVNPLWDCDRRLVGAVNVVVDITELKQADEALRASEQRFRTFVNHATDSFFLFDEKNVVLDMNQQACQALGYTREELLGKRPTDFDPDVTPAELDEMERRLDAGETIAIESRHRRKDGTILPVEVRGKPFWEGGRRFAVCLVRDVTDRKRAEEALRESERRWRSLLEALPQLVWTAMADGSCDYFSTQWTEHTGIPQSDLLGWRWLETLHSDDREATRQAWTAAVQGAGPYDVEYRVRRVDGEYRWFKTRGVPIRDSAGGIFKWFGTCTDITDSKRAEEALRESEERFRGTFENASVGIANVDFDGRWLRVNQRLCDIVGYTREELLQKTFQDITHADDMSISLEKFIPFTQGQYPNFSLQKRYVRKDGSTVWVELFESLQRDAAGNPAYAIVMIQDISERKRLVGELRHAKEAAEAANRAKDEFLANVSHEIRTPMNAILGMTELALDTPLSDDQRQCLKTVKSAADSLLGIINDLLDFAKIEAGKLELDPADFSLRAAMGDTLRALAVRAHKKGLELIYHVQPDVPDGLIGDAGRLRQVLLNLVGNAIKFTNDGEVVVRVEVAGDSAPEGEVDLRFTVRDTGIGIPHEKQATIFRAFEQEDTSTTRKYGGTGLGLTISARLVALMGGTIAVESQLGQGSTFSFSAQFGRQAHQPSACANALPVLLHDLRVLVVDDNAANRHIMEQWLREWQMEPTSVADGMAAMDALWHGVAIGKPHALLLLDQRMPDTDGLALTAKIRERAELSGSRILLLTSGDRPSDLARFRELHVDGHLLKPVQQDELLETIYLIMSRTPEEDNVTRRQGGKVTDDIATSSSIASSKPLRILVAEDSEFNALLMEKLLCKRGHTVRMVSNGRDALALANAADFDLLLLDVHMPELDGFQVIRSIRERERGAGSHLPVIALTARSRREDRDLCLAAGMDGFLAKPIQTDDLWASIDHVAGDRDRAPAATNSPGTRLIDPRVLLAACGGDAAILKSICDTFRAGLPDYLKEVQEPFAAHDAPRLREAAHKLFGMIAAFSTAAGAVASEIEDHAARGELDDAAPLIEQLSAMARELPQVVANVSIESLRSEMGASA